MKFRHGANTASIMIIVSLALSTFAHAADSAAPEWNPNLFRDQSTIQIMTTEPDVGEHWSKLWVVVISGDAYVRLGDRAYGRIKKNTTSPYVRLKVADKEFDKVKVEEMPDLKDTVAAAMADKYFMDILIRHESHPIVARLIPEVSPAPASP